MDKVISIFELVKDKLMQFKWSNQPPAKKASLVALGLCAALPTLIATRYVYIISKRKLFSEVPGPIGWPFLGSILARNKSMKNNGRFFIEMGEKYGPICQLKFGPIKTMYVINHSLIAKKILQEKKLTDRQTRSKKTGNNPVNQGNQRFYGQSLVQIDGKEWHKRRHLAMSLLVHIPSTRFRKIMYDCVVKELFPILDKKCGIANSGSGEDGNEWFMNDELEYFAFNTIYDYNVGKTIGVNDEFFVEYKNFMRGLTSVRIKSIILKYMPFLKYITNMAKEVEICHEKEYKFIEQMIEERKRLVASSSGSGSDSNDNEDGENTSKGYDNYIDAMIEAEKEGKITSQGILQDIALLLFAGTHTSSVTLQVGIVLLAKYQNIQNKVRDALMNVWRHNGMTSCFLFCLLLPVFLKVAPSATETLTF